MSVKHPIVAFTGSSGAGTTTFRRVFDRLFREEGITRFRVDGNAFRRYDRKAMKYQVERALEQGRCLSHFSPEANYLERLEGLFREYSRTGTGLCRRYVENEELAEVYDQPVGSFTPWEEIPQGSELLVYDGLHGGYSEKPWSQRNLSPSHNPRVAAQRSRIAQCELPGLDIARWVDLLIGVVPVINLEWIQKIHRDAHHKGKETENTIQTILRRLPDYINYIVPQFSLTDINFQRVPLSDSSNPFVLRDVPTLDESIVVIRFRDPRGYDFPHYLKRIQGSWMSRRNTMVIPGGHLEHAIRVICAPLVHRLVERYREPAS